MGRRCFYRGTAGDINPFWDETPLDERAYEQMRRMGETAGDEVVRRRRKLTFREVDAIANRGGADPDCAALGSRRSGSPVRCAQ